MDLWALSWVQGRLRASGYCFAADMQVFSASEHIECVRAQVMEKLGMALAFLGPGGNNVVILWVLAASF